MIDFIKYANHILFILFSIVYSYQIFYILIRFIKKLPQHHDQSLNKYAVLIAARNEENVIGDLIESIKDQSYQSELIDVYVIADNCNDKTAAIATYHGAKIIERTNKIHIGKGYALDYALKHIDLKLGIDHYDGYIVFDADNLLDKNYVYELNKVFNQGYDIVTSYRNSKNFATNWISAGYATWFLRESKYLNGSRMLCNVNCAISGTGFVVSSEVLQQDKGWKYHLLTEDIEFTIAKTIEGRKIGYCEKAIIYDEQPIDFSTSWHQRMRWSKGFYQFINAYGLKLVSALYKKKNFQYYDMFATIAPATILTIMLLILNVSSLSYAFVLQKPLMFNEALIEFIKTITNIYLSFYFVGLLTILSEWRMINASNIKKIYYSFTFPLFMFTYAPISVIALLTKVEWKPIKHGYKIQAKN